MESEFIIRKGFISRADSKISGSLELTGSLNISGSAFISGSIETPYSITGSDVKIDEWGSVSASLSAIQSGANTVTLQDVTDNGNTTTNDIYISSSKSLYLGANSYIRREQNGGGNENIQLNGSVRLNPNTSANANNGVVIGGNGYLLAPNSSRVAQLNYGSVSGQLGVYRLNVYGADSTFQYGVAITGSLGVTGGITGSDVRINQWGSVSASLSTIQSQGASVTLQDVTDNGNTTTNDIVLSGSLVFGLPDNNISIGKDSLLGSAMVQNIAIGTNALKSGSNNGINIAIGHSALASGSAPGTNLAIGNSALFYYGLSNATALGHDSLSYALVAGGATGVGRRSLGGAVNATNSTAVGYEAGYGNAGVDLTTYASDSTFIGFRAKPFNSQSINEIVIGSQVTGKGNNTVTIGNASITNNYFSGDISGSDVVIDDWGSVSASLASIGNNTVSSSYALSASYAVSASHAELADLATNAINTSYAQNVTITGKNLSAGTIAKGTPLYFTGSGTSGNLVGIYPADADNPARMPAGGIAGEAITTGNEGIVLISGWINGVDTSAFNAGDQVYVAGGGGYTNTPPTGSALVQKLGNVEKVDNTNGSGVINGPGAVRSVPNIASGFTWVGDGDSVATPTAVSSLSVASAVSASYAATADAVGILNQDVTVSGNLTVFGTASFTSVTSSQLIVDDSFIAVNVFEPAERFGGLRVYDSGSLSHQATASLAWDSLHNHWVYQNASGSTYSGGMFLAGPRNTGSLGDEPSLTRWYVARGDGGDHLNDTQIYSSGSKTDITGSLTTTGKLTVGTVDNYGADPDKFLSIVNGEVVYRTGAQLLSDIGGQTAGTFVQNDGSGGTARYIMRYADSNSATTSSIYEDTSGRIGINKTTPDHALDINGSNIQIGNILIGRGQTPNTGLVIGSGSLTTFTGSSSQTVVGNNAVTNLTTGVANDAFGAYTLNETTTGTYNTAFGQSAGRKNNGDQNVFFGQFSGPFYHSLSGDYNVFIGPLAGINTSGSAAKNTAIGASSLYNLSDGIENTGIGSAALFDVTTGSGNIAFGFNTARGITTGNYNIVIGNGVTGLSSGLSNNIIIADGQGNIKYRYADNNTTISGSLTIDGAADIVQEGIATTGTTSLTLKSINTSTYQGAFLDYVISNGNNRRAGTLTVVWTTSDIEWKDTSTLDLGSTDGAEFAPAINGSNADLVLSLPTGTWTVKGHLRYM